MTDKPIKENPTWPEMSQEDFVRHGEALYSNTQNMTEQERIAYFFGEWKCEAKPYDAKTMREDEDDRQNKD